MTLDFSKSKHQQYLPCILFRATVLWMRENVPSPIDQYISPMRSALNLCTFSMIRTKNLTTTIYFLCPKHSKLLGNLYFHTYKPRLNNHQMVKYLLSLAANYNVETIKISKVENCRDRAGPSNCYTGIINTAHSTVNTYN